MAPDEQDQAEQLDDDELGHDAVGAADGPPLDFPPDVPLGVEEARHPIDTGDVPQDSLRERSWREIPDVDEQEPSSSDDLTPEGDVPAEEAALHIEEG